ncbi:hypothetical protein WKC56_03615 [Morganella morganii]
MNQSDFAKLHGVSRKTITAWKAGAGWFLTEMKLMLMPPMQILSSTEKPRQHQKLRPNLKKQSSVLLLTLTTNHQSRQQKD